MSLKKVLFCLPWLLFVACSSTSTFYITSVKSHSVSIAWEDSLFENEPREEGELRSDGEPLSYLVSYILEGISTASNEVETEKNSHTFEGLMADRIYTFQVRAKYANGSYSYYHKSTLTRTKPEDGESTTKQSVSDAPPETVKIHGFIADYKTSQPINIVNVRPSTGSSTTSARGSYSLMVAYGKEISLTFAHNDYIAHTKKVTATEDTLLDVKLVPKGQGLGVIEGFVTNQNGYPIDGATVRIEANTITTDATGWYSVAGVGVGAQTINVSKGGGSYQIYSKEVVIDENAVTTHHPKLAQDGASTVAENTTTTQASNVQTGDTYLDPNTDLMWQNQPLRFSDKKAFDSYQESQRVLTWSNAKQYCEDLVLNGFDNWQLPDSYELLTLRTGTKNKSEKGYEYYIIEEMLPSMPPLNGINAFAHFWSSKNEERDSLNGWGVDFSMGQEVLSFKGSFAYVLCKRDTF